MAAAWDPGIVGGPYKQSHIRVYNWQDIHRKTEKCMCSGAELLFLPRCCWSTYDECAAAINAGASCFTHTYNGQRGLHHREPGVVGAAMTTPNTYAEIICDGKHVNPAAIKALLQAKGWQHTVLITDCLGCGGMPEGSYTSGGMDVIMKDNLCWLADGKSIAGSVLTLAQGVKNIVDWGIASADIAIRMATEVPARSAHIEDKCGSIMPGRDADFVVFDHELTLVETYVGGQSVGNAFTE